MCDAKDIIERLKDIVEKDENTRQVVILRPSTVNVQCADSHDSTSTCSSTPMASCRDFGRRLKSQKQQFQTPRQYSDPNSSQGRDHQREDIPCCGGPYEVRCKQTLDGQVGKPTLVCTINEQTEQPYGGMVEFQPTYKSHELSQKKGMLQRFLDKQQGCSGINGFCPASRYNQFMAGFGGLPQGHPDYNQPEKFHYAFGMGVKNHDLDYDRP